MHLNHAVYVVRSNCMHGKGNIGRILSLISKPENLQGEFTEKRGEANQENQADRLEQHGWEKRRARVTQVLLTVLFMVSSW